MEVEEPQEIVEAATAVVGNLLPAKSKKSYDMAYKNFKIWCAEKNVETLIENVLLVFFGEKAERFKSLSLWAQYLMIKACMGIYDNVDVSRYPKLIALLKRNSDGYLPKKSKVITRENVETYLAEADDNEHLMIKVEIFEIAGACRAEELTNLSVDNIQGVGSSLIISIPNTKNKLPRKFVVTEEQDNHYQQSAAGYKHCEAFSEGHRQFKFKCK